ncbi:glycosyl hydrolase-related protein, partial [Streptomyces sp. AC627_RSS907]
TVRLSLLRAPRYPDPETDHGHHRLRYALAPGATVADAVREGHRINLPERTVTGGRAVEPLVSVAGDQVIVEAVKLAEDRGGDIVVRLYESGGGRASTTLTASVPVAEVVETDLLERPLADAPKRAFSPEGALELTLRPFQILTLRLTPRG